MLEKPLTGAILYYKYEKGSIRMKLAYPCRIKSKNDMYRISFRDFKELCAESRSYEEALETAEEVLNNLLEIMLEEDDMPRSPSLPKAGEVLIPVRPGISGRIS